MADELKICLICGVDANKKQKHDRYNYVPPKGKIKGKYQASEESESDSDDPKSKKKPAKRPPPRATVSVGTRQTRNQNPKAFSTSLCKVMLVPDSPDEPFVHIFQRASYCAECLPKVKEAHLAQSELDRAQAKVDECRMDIEIEMSKHLNTIKVYSGLLRKEGHDVHENDLKLIMDYNGSVKKSSKIVAPVRMREPPKRERRQAAINSSLKMKRKRGDTASEDVDEDEDEEEAEVKVKTKKGRHAAEVTDDDFRPDESTSSETEKEEPQSSPPPEVPEEEPEKSNDNNGVEEKPEPEVKEEDKPVEIVKPKKDPNLKCPHCPVPRYFNFAENLTEHISKTHAHCCETCEKRFKSESDLRKHKEKVHVQRTEEKAVFVCGFCDKDFQLKKYLEDHLDQHPEAKPLNCHACGRGFSRKESLQKAFQIYKGEDVEGCKNCGKNLNLKDYLEHNRKLKEG